MTLRKPRLELIVTLAILLGGGLVATVQLAQLLHQSEADETLTASLWLYSGPVTDPAALAADDFAFLGDAAWASLSAADVDSIRLRNIDIRLGALTGIHVWQWTKHATEGRGALWWSLLSPYLARTDTGDTCAAWQDDYLLDITQPAAREAWCDLVAATMPEAADALFLEFYAFPVIDLKVYQAARFQQAESGWLDADRDGVPHDRDADEREIWRASLYELVRELRQHVRPGTLLIENQGLALTDRAFCRLLDGAYLEDWPRPCSGNWTVDWTRTLNPLNPASMPALTEPGRWATSPGYVFCEDLWGTGQAAAMAPRWPGAVATKRVAR